MPKDGGSPAAAPPAGKFHMRPKRVRRACRSMGSGAGDRLTGGSDGSNGRRGRSSGCDRPRLRALMRMRGTRHARYLQTLPQPYSYAAYLTQPYSYADIFLRRICYCRIFLRRYYVGHNATAAILRRYSLLQLYSTVDITATAAILTSHAHNVLPTHLIPSSLKVSHRSSSLPP